MGLIRLIQCRKHSFTAGFYFFLLWIFYQIYSFIAPIYISRFIDSHLRENNPLWGLTLGDLMVLISFIPRIIELVAFGILVLGLYRMWNTKTVKT